MSSIAALGLLMHQYSFSYMDIRKSLVLALDLTAYPYYDLSAASYQYRTLIDRLAHKYRCIAPDLPGFGFTEVPESRKYAYTFENFGKTITAFVDTLKLERFAIYMFA